MTSPHSGLPAPAASPAAARRIAGNRGVFLTVGVLLLLFAFYESNWTNIASNKKQDQGLTGLLFLFMEVVFPWESSLMPYDEVAVWQRGEKLQPARHRRGPGTQFG